MDGVLWQTGSPAGVFAGFGASAYFNSQPALETLDVAQEKLVYLSTGLLDKRFPGADSEWPVCGNRTGQPPSHQVSLVFRRFRGVGRVSCASSSPFSQKLSDDHSPNPSTDVPQPQPPASKPSPKNSPPAPAVGDARGSARAGGKRPVSRRAIGRRLGSIFRGPGGRQRRRATGHRHGERGERQRVGAAR